MSKRKEVAEKRSIDQKNKQLILLGLFGVALVGYGFADYLEFHNLFRESPPDGVRISSEFSNKDYNDFAQVANAYESKYTKCPFELVITPSKTVLIASERPALGATVSNGHLKNIFIYFDKSGQGNKNVFAHEIVHGCSSEVLEYESPLRLYSPDDNISILELTHVEGLKLHLNKYDGHGNLSSNFVEIRIEEFVIETMVARDGYKTSLNIEFILGRRIFEPYLTNIPNTELDFYLRKGKVLDLAYRMFPRATYEESLREVLRLLDRVPKPN